MRWPGIIGVLVSVLLLWWTLRDVELSELLAHLRRVNVPLMLAAVAVSTIVFPLRTIRWRYLLELDGQRLPFRPLWHATAVGFMANNILPARSGEVARAYVAHKLTGARFTTVAATLVVERILDGLTLLTILAVAASLGGFATGSGFGTLNLTSLVVTGATGVFVALAVTTFAVVKPEIAKGILHRVLDTILPQKWAHRIGGILDGLFDGIAVLRKPKRLATVLVWSFIVWGVNGVSFLLAMWAFTMAVPTSAAFVLESTIAFGVAIPSTPGFFGPFEAATRLTLAAYGVSGAEAAAYAAAYHITTFIPITVLGLFSLTRAHLHLTDLRSVRTIK